MKLTEKQRALFSNILKALKEADDEEDWDYEMDDDITDDDLNDDGSDYTDLFGDEDLAKMGWEKTDRKDGETNVPAGSKHDNPDYWGHDVFVKHGKIRKDGKKSPDKYRSRWELSNGFTTRTAARKYQGSKRGGDYNTDKELYNSRNGDDAAYTGENRYDFADDASTRLPSNDIYLRNLEKGEWDYDSFHQASAPYEIDVPEDAKWFD